MARRDAGQPELRVEYVPTAELTPYVGNAKEHPEWQVEEIAESIKQFGFSDPVGAWHNPETGEAEIVEGHGRLLAAQELGMGTVPVVWLDHLDDEGRRAYGLAHNQLTMNSGFDEEKLQAELASLGDIDMTLYGFDGEEQPGEGSDGEGDGLSDEYSKNIGTVDYEPKETDWAGSDLFDTEEYDRLGEVIEGVKDPDVRRLCELRRAIFANIRFSRVADYYAYQATPKEQRAFEALGLVLLDRDGMVANGFADIVGEL